MTAPSIAIVIPSNRPEMFKDWYNAWQPIFEKHDVAVVLVEDNEGGTPYLLDTSHRNVHLWRADVPSFVPTKTGAIRSIGFLYAWHKGYDIVITMDDDCLPVGDTSDLIGNYLLGFDAKYPVSPYFDIGRIFGLGHPMRGMPDCKYASPLVQYGGWDNVPDFGAEYQQSLQNQDLPIDGYRFDRRILAAPTGIPFTGCIMNVAFKREAIPMMYQLIMGMDTLGYDRWDDIWSGLLIKKICDYLSIPVVINGHATIRHSRASDPKANVEKERNGIAPNQLFWEGLTRFPLHSDNIIDCYSELATPHLSYLFGQRGHLVTTGMRDWIEQFQ